MLQYSTIPWILLVLSNLIGLSLTTILVYLSYRAIKLGEKAFYIQFLSWMCFTIAQLIEVVHYSSVVASYLYGEIMFLDPFTQRYELMWKSASFLYLIAFSGFLTYHLLIKRLGNRMLVFIPLLLTEIEVAVFVVSLGVTLLVFANPDKELKSAIGFALLSLSHLAIALEGLYIVEFGLFIAAAFRLLGLSLLLRVVW